MKEKTTKKTPREKDDETNDRLRLLSIIASNAVPFASAIPGKPNAAMLKKMSQGFQPPLPILPSIGADVPFYGGQVPQMARAFSPDATRDERLNTVLQNVARFGVDQGSDAVLRAGIGLAQTRGVPINPLVSNAAFYGKNLVMNPAYGAMDKAIWNNNLGTKAADAIKPIDDLINNSNLQTTYSQILPLLKAYADSQIGNTNKTDLQEGVLEADRRMDIADIFPENTRSAVRDVTQSVSDNYKDVSSKIETVAKGTKPFAKQFKKVFLDTLRNTNVPMAGPMIGRK